MDKKNICNGCIYNEQNPDRCTFQKTKLIHSVDGVYVCNKHDQQMTRKEVVEMRGIAYSTLYEWIDDGLLRTYKKKRPYFKKSDVENYKPEKVGRPRSVKNG